MKLINGETIQEMSKLADSSVDLILADLPYGTTRNKWDSIIPLDKLWKQYNRIIKDNGAILLFGQQPFTSVLVSSNLKMYKYDWTWIKESGTGFLNAKKMPLKDSETISVFYKKLPVYNPQMRNGFKPYTAKKGNHGTNYGSDKGATTVSNGERYPLTTVHFSRDKDKLHPTQKPVKLLEYLIKTYTNDGDVVMDNVMGSGSTGVACANTNRDFIGIELDKKYFEIAKNRINEAKS